MEFSQYFYVNARLLLETGGRGEGGGGPHFSTGPE